jgi:hypothetical protein
MSSASAIAVTGLFSTPHRSRAKSSDITNVVPYFRQGETGPDSINNCGPATVAAAINYSGVASPSVEDVRNTLGAWGPTSTDQWTWLLDAYNVPWRATWSKQDMDQAVRGGCVVIIAAWMADLSSGPDFEQAGSPNRGQIGRYDGFSLGHAMLIVGSVDNQQNYQVHDPNVFSDEAFDWYGDGSPKGRYRLYNAGEIWTTVYAYAGGFGIAVAPPASNELEPPSSSRQVQAGAGDVLVGPAGGQPPQRVAASGGSDRLIPSVSTSTLIRAAGGSAGGFADVK